MMKVIDQLANLLMQRQWKLVTAESCTGGGLAFALTSLAGSSQWFERGLVTYSNTAKIELLGVNPATLTQFGAVSQETAQEMAEGALRHSHAHISIAITGVAGPEGGTADKPVGTVWIACAAQHLATHCQLFTLSGDRDAIREQAIEQALKCLINFMNPHQQ